MDLQTRILPEPYNTVPASSVHGSERLPSGSLFPGLTDRRRPAVLPRPTPPLPTRHELPAQGRQPTRKNLGPRCPRGRALLTPCSWAALQGSRF